jgi:RNA polymerase sigma-70 factor (ECF subfamily)
MDGLNIDEIAALYQVHRATAARWLASARAQLLEKTRRRMSEQLQLKATETHAVFGLIQSQVDVSLSRLLSEPTATIEHAP